MSKTGDRIDLIRERTSHSIELRSAYVSAERLKIQSEEFIRSIGDNTDLDNHTRYDLNKAHRVLLGSNIRLVACGLEQERISLLSSIKSDKKVSNNKIEKMEKNYKICSSLFELAYGIDNSNIHYYCLLPIEENRLKVFNLVCDFDCVVARSISFGLISSNTPLNSLIEGLAAGVKKWNNDVKFRDIHKYVEYLEKTKEVINSFVKKGILSEDIYAEYVEYLKVVKENTEQYTLTKFLENPRQYALENSSQKEFSAVDFDIRFDITLQLIQYLKNILNEIIKLKSKLDDWCFDVSILNNINEYLTNCENQITGKCLVGGNTLRLRKAHS